jgi:hypothetical protein
MPLFSATSSLTVFVSQRLTATDLSAWNIFYIFYGRLSGPESPSDFRQNAHRTAPAHLFAAAMAARIIRFSARCASPHSGHVKAQCLGQNISKTLHVKPYHIHFKPEAQLEAQDELLFEAP